MKTESKKGIATLMPMLFAFFVMGFVDVTGIATGYVKRDFALSDSLANLLPMMVFVWFALCSLPTGMVMDRIGRKPTVVASLLITAGAMLLPVAGYSFGTVLAAFVLLGIGNTVLQVSLNPLLLCILPPQRVTGMLTLGQFVKAISSTLGPVIAGAAVAVSGSWQLIFPIYGITAIVSALWIFFTPVTEQPADRTARLGFGAVLGMLGRGPVLLAFTVILLCVGFEIGLMTAVPRYMVERAGLTIEEGSLGCSVYFAARTLGTLAGSILLSRYSPRRFLQYTMVAAVVLMGVFLQASNTTVLMVLLFLIGLTCANIFPITYSLAIQRYPEQANAISALMIMGVAGGAILPLPMGFLADAGGQWLALLVPFAALVYILIASFRMKEGKDC